MTSLAQKVLGAMPDPNLPGVANNYSVLQEFNNGTDKAGGKVDLELMKYARKVLGKARLLYQLAKAAKGQPDGVVRDVIYPAVGEKTLEDIIRETEAAENYEHRVK